MFSKVLHCLGLIGLPVSDQIYILIFICFLWLIKDSITKISLSPKEGIQAELKQLQVEKDKLRILNREMQRLKVTLIENSKRWGGWNDSRYNREIEEIRN